MTYRGVRRDIIEGEVIRKHCWPLGRTPLPLFCDLVSVQPRSSDISRSSAAACYIGSLTAGQLPSIVLAPFSPLRFVNCRVWIL